MNRLAGSAVLLLGLASSLSIADELNADEQAVWQLEVAYWEYVKANDIPGYRSLWDERFSGWPGFSEMPLGKENIHEWVVALHDGPAVDVEVDLTLGSVRAYGDVVAAHYLVRYTRTLKETGETVGNTSVSRITHTWQRRGDGWQIITGMSGSWIGEGQ